MLKDKVSMARSISETGVTKEKFYATLDDQCTGENPRYPLIRGIKQMYINTFESAAKV